MDTRQHKSIVDHLLTAKDEQDCSLARYRLSTAMEAANDDIRLDIETARAPVSAQMKQAQSTPS